MSQYLVKLSTNAQPESLSGGELKRRASTGELPRTALVSKDGTTWHPAAKVKGLFEASVRATSAVAPARAAVIASEASHAPYAADSTPGAVAVAPSPAQSVEYFTHRIDSQAAIRPRSVMPFMVVAGLALVVWGVAVAGSVMEDLWLGLGGAAGLTLVMIPLLILWLVWLYKAHNDMRELTAGTYPISAGAAVGFSFIPLFDAYWVVYMPYRLAVEANRHLSARGQAQIPAGAVMACQIASILVAFILPGLTPALYGTSMLLVQSGLNRLGRAG